MLVGRLHQVARVALFPVASLANWDLANLRRIIELFSQWADADLPSQTPLPLHRRRRAASQTQITRARVVRRGRANNLQTDGKPRRADGRGRGR